jgi:hypothetical protein
MAGTKWPTIQKLDKFVWFSNGLVAILFFTIQKPDLLVRFLNGYNKIADHLKTEPI